MPPRCRSELTLSSQTRYPGPRLFYPEARVYPEAGTGSCYYFAEKAFVDKAEVKHHRWARIAWALLARNQSYVAPAM